MEVYFASGGRKTSVARVKLRLGTGKIFINGRTPQDYFKDKNLLLHFTEPLRVLQKENDFDIIAKVKGGGLSGQAGALRLAIAKSLVEYNEGFKKTLKTRKLLTRDPRKKERMKYGLTKRRKAHQYSKR